MSGVAIVKFSEMGTRSDPEYHVARVNHKAEVDRLLKLSTETLDRLCGLVPPTPEAIRAVVRGTGRGLQFIKSGLLRYTREEKALFIAMCVNGLGGLEQQAQALDRRAQELRDLEAEIRGLLA
jgi:hypothetical protein